MSARKALDIEQFVTSPKYLGDNSISVAQLAILKAIYGLPLERDQRVAFLEMTEGRPPKAGGYKDVTLMCGRRSGKSEKIIANIGAFEAMRFNPKLLAPGQVAYVPIIAQNTAGADEVRRYIEGKLLTLDSRGFDVFDHGYAQQKAITEKLIKLRNRVHIAIFACTKASIRGKTLICLLADEIAFWQTEADAYNADVEVMRAARPGMATFGKWAKRIKASTPFGEDGVLYEAWRERTTSRALFCIAETEYMNPAIPAEFLAEERLSDPDGFDREYRARFGKQTGAYLQTDLIRSCMNPDRPAELPPKDSVEYKAQIDVGFKKDLFAFAVAHLDGERVVFDVIRWWKPTKGRVVDEDEVLPEIAECLEQYGLDVVPGDQYCDVPIQTAFGKLGVTFRLDTQTELTNETDYKNLKAAMKRGLVELPSDEMVRQDLGSLVAKKAGNRWKVAAPDRKGLHDDIAKVVSRLVMMLLPNAGRWDLAAINAAAQQNTRDREDWDEVGMEDWATDIMGTVL